MPAGTLTVAQSQSRRAATFQRWAVRYDLNTLETGVTGITPFKLNAFSSQRMLCQSQRQKRHHSEILSHRRFVECGISFWMAGLDVIFAYENRKENNWPLVRFLEPVKNPSQPFKEYSSTLHSSLHYILKWTSCKIVIKALKGRKNAHVLLGQKLERRQKIGWVFFWPF